jgi:ParB/RepB/Spo0J family partition protein
MKIRKVKIEDIQIPEVRVTARFSEEEWEQFRSSLKEVGAIAPIICIENEKGLFLVDGLHRLMESKANGVKMIEVAVIPGNKVTALTRNIFLDHLRGKTPVSEMVMVIKHLMSEYHLDSEQIAVKTGLTRTRIEQMQELSRLTPFILEQLDEGRLTIGKAHVLTKIKDPIIQETVAHQALLYPRWTVFELEEYVDGVLNIVHQKEEAPPAVAAEPYLFTCQFCGEKHEAHEVASPVICIDCSGTLHYAISQAKAQVEVERRAKENEAKTP